MIEKSDNVTKYVHQVAQLLDLKISPDFLPGVTDNFTKLAAIASLVTDFELSSKIEVTPTFDPSDNLRWDENDRFL